MSWLSPPTSDGICEPVGGSCVTDVIAEAITLSTILERVITFQFNGVVVTVSGRSDANLIYRDWARALVGSIEKDVGPYPNPVLTEEEKANDARVEAENQRQREKASAQITAMRQTKRTAVEAKLATAPPIELADEDAWLELCEKNQDPLGVAVITYAERWARLMQAELAKGRKIEDVATATSHEADHEGISGAMHQLAYQTLKRYWKNGRQLRK